MPHTMDASIQADLDTFVWDGTGKVPQNVTKVRISDGVRSIRNLAFNDCTGLTSVTIPEGVQSIGAYAFWRCSSLTSVIIPNSVTSIGDEAFSWCTGLRSITMPSRFKYEKVKIGIPLGCTVIYY